MRKHLLPFATTRALGGLALLGLAVLGVAGCATPGTAPSPATTSASSPAGAPSSSGPAGSATSSTDTGTAPDPVSDFRITYGFAVPSTTVTIPHPFPVPPLRQLVGIYVGDHPSESPAYQRISFYFKGGYPSYRFSYVPSVTSDGSGAPVSLPGNAFVSIVFTDAQAHTDSGSSSVVASPPANIGLQNLKGYKPAGDFEGHVSFGLGLQVAAGSDQVLPIRTGELTRTEPSGKVFVVFFDIRTA